MKILLQHARTGLYFRSLGEWTDNSNEAFDFEHSQKASDFAHENRLAGVLIAVKFIDGKFDETFALLPHAVASVPLTHARA